MSDKLTVCTNCVLDTTVEDITFDSHGVCNYCHKFEEKALPVLNLSSGEKEKKFNSVIETIKESGKDKKYDCILGLSGGVDSSYLALLAKRNGLKPLLVHFDNGWNSELAVKNIEKIIETCGFDLHTVVIDWEEFRHLQLAYIRASVVDIEVPTDHLIVGALYSIAKQKSIKCILSGTNFATEFTMPTGWNFFTKGDFANMKGIYHKHGKGNLKKLVTYSYYQKFINANFRGIRSISMLNYTDYSKANAKEELIKHFGWKDYGGKHYESIFTRFYQGYILPNKFNIDKRKTHLSNLICTGEITRDEALAELSQPTYPESNQKEDLEYVLRKLQMTQKEFDQIMASPEVPHSEFGLETDSIFYTLFNKIAYFVLFKFAYPLKLVKR
ncbi:MAG: N-acetyl sugar amidotransferase [Flavobacteriales bacterium]|nr:N-acetyl sugar amidotransferase [Flavobacteriales bacterium]